MIEFQGNSGYIFLPRYYMRHPSARNFVYRKVRLNQDS